MHYARACAPVPALESFFSNVEEANTRIKYFYLIWIFKIAISNLYLISLLCFYLRYKFFYKTEDNKQDITVKI